MGTLELKSNLHRILDQIDNEQLLQTVYDFLKQRQSSEEGQIWRTLNATQKTEVLLSYEESEDDEKLKSWDDVKSKY